MTPTTPSVISRINTYRAGPEFTKHFRYVMQSVISTLLTLGLLGLFYGVLKLASATLCNVYATILTIIPSYYLNRLWVWGKSGKSHFMKEVVPFWVIAIGSGIISTVIVHLADHASNHLSHGMRTLVVEAANFGTYGVLWIAKFILFNKVLFKHDHHHYASAVAAP